MNMNQNTSPQGNKRTIGAAPADGESEGPFKDTPDYARFKARVLKKSGIDLNQYKQQQMHRRLLNMVDRASLPDFDAYFDRLEKDPREYAAFLDRMTINVSELFRNPEKWKEMREVIVPMLMRHRSALRIWSAGCSYGAEPYSLAILMDQIAPGKGHAIHATDLDQNILAKAREGLFTSADVKNIDAKTLSQYFTELKSSSQEIRLPDVSPRHQVRPGVRQQVRFRAHNLLADRFEGDYDLICCRNVVIYFTDEAKDVLFQRFAQALRPGGILFVGGTERIFNSREIGFDSPLPFFYKKAEERAARAA